MSKPTVTIQRLDTAQLNTLIAEIETEHPEFADLYADESCSCCKIDYSWSIEKQEAWRRYGDYRFLRGDAD